MHTSKDIVELPSNGKAMIVTDIHGNLKDYDKIIELWKSNSQKKDYLIFTGDLINALGGQKDGSIEILEKLIRELKFRKNLYVLLGNHEWATITQISVYKGGENQAMSFKKLLKSKFQDDWELKLDQYIKFFKQLPIAVKTSNKIFISHAGPPVKVKSLDDLYKITENGYQNNQPLFEILWNRYDDITTKDVDNFLDIVGCKAMIVGHTPVDGFKLFGNQLIVSSSYSKGKKTYVGLDLEKEINKAQDLLKMIKYIQ